MEHSRGDKRVALRAMDGQDSGIVYQARNLLQQMYKGHLNTKLR